MLVRCCLTSLLNQCCQLDTKNILLKTCSLVMLHIDEVEILLWLCYLRLDSFISIRYPEVLCKV